MDPRTKVSTKTLRILFVHDSPEEVGRIIDELRARGFELQFERVDSAEALRSALEVGWDIILSDYTSLQLDVCSALRMLRAAALDLPVIVVSHAVETENVVRALRAGARNFLPAGDLTRLASAIECELGASSEPERPATVLASRVAHEINNPLAYVIGNLEFALERLAQEPAQSPDLAAAVTALGQAREGSERIRETVRGFGASSIQPVSSGTGFAAPSGKAIRAIASAAALGSDASGEPQTPGTATRSGVAPALRARILVIDDEPALCALLKRLLDPENEVVAMLKARSALAQLATDRRFDLILCDLMMPEMTGMDFHDELSRSMPELSSRVVFLTGGAFTSQAAGFLARVPNRRLEKPFDATTLRATLAKLMNRAA